MCRTSKGLSHVLRRNFIKSRKRIADEWRSLRLFAIVRFMSETSAISKLAGGAGKLAAIIGLAAFFLGIFGPVRNFLFVGLAMLAFSLAAFFVEEFGPRK